MEFDFQTRLDRLNALRSTHEAPDVWLLRPANFAWLTGGNSVVDRTSPHGVAAVGFDGDRLQLLTSNNERERIVAEELPGVPEDGIELSVTAFEWHETTIPEAVREHSSENAVTDGDVPGLDRVDTTGIHTPLTPTDREAYRSDSEAVAASVEDVAREVTSEMTEREATATLVSRLIEAGFEVPVALVGGASRAVQHRHFTPTDADLGDFCHLTVVAARAGRNVAVTRTVAFDPPSWLLDRHRSASRVASSAVSATREVGRSEGTATAVFDAIRKAYAAVGYPDEWRLHHQGGPIGYETREWIATPGNRETVPLPMTYAWNPTVQGSKTEDTVLVSADDVSVLSRTGNWPTTEHESVDGAETLATHDVLIRE